MDRTKKKIEVQARVRVIGKLKRQELTRPENFNTVVEIERSAIYAPGAQQTLVETATRKAFVDHFLKRMRHDADAKRRVGGTRWEVDVLELRYKDAV